MKFDLHRLVPTPLLDLVDSLRSSFWFVPLIMMLGAAVLAGVTIPLDNWAAVEEITLIPFFEETGPEGARAVLSAIAGSMITVTALVFSLTIVALTLASSQFGPRLLRNFMRDQINQVVLGMFVSTFLYCLLVLLTVRGADDYRRVPLLGMTLAVVLTVSSLLVLVFFIHHVAVAIQASTVIDAVGSELKQAIHDLYPEVVGEPLSEDEQARAKAELEDLRSREAAMVRAASAGYVRLVDGDSLLEIAEEADLVIDLLVGPGDFLIAGQEVARVWPRDRAESEDRIDDLRGAITLGPRRTSVQDVGYPVNQLVEIALRSLSPGINDPFTAVSCVHQIGQGLRMLADRPWPSRARSVEDGKLRLWVKATTFEQLARSAIDPIRGYGDEHPLVMVALIEVLESVHRIIDDGDRKESLRELIDSVREAGLRAAPSERDRHEIETAGGSQVDAAAC